MYGIISIYKSKNRISSKGIHSARPRTSLSFLPDHPHETIFSPVFSKTITHHPIWSGILLAIIIKIYLIIKPNHSQSMVKFITILIAVSTIIDAATIVNKSPSITVYLNSHWTLGDCVPQILLTIGGNGSTARYLKSRLRYRAGFACTANASIRIVIFKN